MQELSSGHRDWKQIPLENTAMAAKKVAEDGDVTQASVSSAFAAKCFGLKVLKENIYSNKANSTRFIIVTNQRIYQKDAKKISICFETPHTSGSLYNILSHFIYNNLNMFGIQSRPIQGRNWEYRFFNCFEGNLNDSAVKMPCVVSAEEATNMKILGNYWKIQQAFAKKLLFLERLIKMFRIDELIVYREYEQDQDRS